MFTKPSVAPREWASALTPCRPCFSLQPLTVRPITPVGPHPAPPPVCLRAHGLDAGARSDGTWEAGVETRRILLGFRQAKNWLQLIPTPARLGVGRSGPEQSLSGGPWKAAAVPAHCASPRGTEAAGARVCRVARTASCAGPRERKEVEGVRRLLPRSEAELPLCPPALGSLPPPGQGRGPGWCGPSSESLWTGSFPDTGQQAAA